MTRINFTDMPMVPPYQGSNIEIKAQMLLVEYVNLLNHQIVVCVLMILTGFIFSYIFLPRCKEGILELSSFSNNPYWQMLTDFCLSLVDKLISLSETFAIASSMVLFGFAYFQGVVGKKSLIWAVCLVGFVFLVLIIEIIGYFRTGKYKRIANLLRGWWNG